MEKRRKRIPIPIKILEPPPHRKPPVNPETEQPLMTPEEIEEAKKNRCKTVRLKSEDKKADMPKVWEHKEL